MASLLMFKFGFQAALRLVQQDGFFIPLFANPEMQKQAQLILSIIGIVGHENAADYLAKLELATECDNDESD